LPHSRSILHKHDPLTTKVYYTYRGRDC